MESKNIYLFRN